MGTYWVISCKACLPVVIICVIIVMISIWDFRKGFVITARQQSCEKVMFSLLSCLSMRGPHGTITHDALELTIEETPPLVPTPLCTVTLSSSHYPSPSLHLSPLSLGLATPICTGTSWLHCWWHLVAKPEVCSNLFTCGPPYC